MNTLLPYGLGLVLATITIYLTCHVAAWALRGFQIAGLQ